MSRITRRTFLKQGTAAAAALTIVPNTILGKSHGYTAPTDRMNIAGVGVASMGAANLRSMEQENIVALCDVDWNYSKKTFEKYPDAKRYWDYRKMYDEMGKSIDGVMIATADHSHAIITADAITMGKHVFTQKPLTHTVYESRLLTKLADKYNIVSQMGNQGASGDGVRKICEWIWNGEIGEVRRVDAFTDRPIWPQGLNAPEKTDRIPKTFNWDLFVGPANMRPYNHIYHPWNWRGWWDFGTGALGDMACHILHSAFAGLKLGYPTKVQGSSTMLLQDCAPQAQYVRMIFPERENLPKVTLPEVEVNWYDGGITPVLPPGWPEGKELNMIGGATIFYGSKDILVCGCYGRDPFLLSGRVPNVTETIKRVEGGESGHEKDWIRVCKQNAGSREKTSSDFSVAGPFNEMVVMGVLAVRLQTLNKELEWDGPNMRFTNIRDNETIRILKKDDFHVVDGDPKFNKIWNDPINAQQFAKELIKHNYREGWKLVDMPV